MMCFLVVLVVLALLAVAYDCGYSAGFALGRAQAHEAELAGIRRGWKWREEVGEQVSAP